ncbi:GNAT family N-acetyltransferase [Vibrio profundum]|uniref:GNAT family N-acetyltransferase n=1 Tax=Vibrio profundum TaxID=2910247 RepID=UPI003D0B7182
MEVTISPITPSYDEQVRQIIQSVGEEFGAVGEGFGPGDAEVLNMSQHYTEDRKSLYLLATLDNEVVGGCGIAPFSLDSAPDHEQSNLCELKKLFLLPKARGLGLGKQLTLACLDYAQSHGYSRCYLDTLSSMQSAVSLYKSLGFEHLDAPLEGTIHSKCDVWMIKEL